MASHVTGSDVSASAGLPLVTITREVMGVAKVEGARMKIGPATKMPRSELLEFIRGADVVGTMFHDRVDEEFLAAAGPRLRGVCNFAVGYDNFDLAACAKRGVVVTNTPDAVTEGTANLAFALLLAVARRLVEADAFVRSGGFAKEGSLSPAAWTGMHTTGQTLLIIGPGRIGMAMALRAVAFGMRILYASRQRHVEFELAPIVGRRVELDEGLALADFVSIHCPLTPATRGLLDARRIGLLKKTAIVINTARGPIIDEAALAAALRDRRIWGAGLDVFEREPEVHPELAKQANAVLTPHIGSAEKRFREIMTELVCANAAAILAGKAPPNLVHAGG